MSNVFSFTGRLGRDAEKTTTNSGMSILTMNLANECGYGDNKKILWISASLFGKRAEGRLIDYLRKGTKVFISGELSQYEYPSKQQENKTALQVNVNIVELIESGPGAKKKSTAPKQATDTVTTQQSQPDFDDDLPF